MALHRSQLFLGLLAGAFGIGLTLTLAAAATQDDKPRPVEELIPAGTVLFAGQDGMEKHKAAWEQTAAYESMYESGMVRVVEKVFEWVGQMSGSQQNPEVEQALKHLEAHGLTIAVSLPVAQGPPIPQVTIVLHEAAKYEPMLSGLARSLGGAAGAQFDQQDVQDRTITRAMIPNSPGIEVGIWAEGEHLIVVAGRDAVRAGISVAKGDAPNLTTNKLWTKYNYDTKGFETTSVGWLDFKSLRNTFGQIPIPESSGKTINDVLKTVGLHNVDTIAGQYGYKGKALWSETAVEVDGPRTGLLALSDQKPMTLADLPPLPSNTNGFNAMRIEPAVMWDTLTQLIRDGMAFAPPEAAGQTAEVLDNLPQIVGFDPKTELFGALGDITCVFADPDQGFFGTGMGAMIKVLDPEKVKTSVNKLLLMAEQSSRGEFRVHRSQKHGREMLLFQFGPVQAGALTIDDGWLIAGLMPQSVEATLLRIDGTLDSWKPTQLQTQAFDALPKSFTSITVGDPQGSWQALIKLAPLIMAGGQVALREQRIIPPGMDLPITIADIPPAELVVRPLFPNVAVTTSDENGIHITSRQSLPGIPIIAGISEGNGVVTVAIGTALLLPAIQQAREAARRTQSKNNLKQIALALHNYADTYQGFPAGTHPNEKLKPEERLSWQAAILPFIEQSALHQSINFEEAWDDESNKKAAETRVPIYMNPGYPAVPVGAAETHYVGIAGLGKDAPILPANSNRAGVFAFNRKTSFRDITDGTSNTMMMSEASGQFGSWIAGGNATIRSLTKKPYINGPDGIGGPSRGGVNVGLADGSVRFVSENVDPVIFERLSTMADGQLLGDF